MITNCNECCAEVEDYEVVKCPVCDSDGMCVECLNGGHDDGNDKKCYGTRKKAK